MKLEELKKIVEEIEKEREFVKKVLNGEIKDTWIERKDFLKTTLMIVESPNKARTIANFFWKPSKRVVKGLNVYEVSIWKRQLLITASGGHIVDLVVRKYTENLFFYGVEFLEDKYYPFYDTIKKCIYKYNEEEQVQIVDDFEKCKKVILDKIDFIQAIQKSSLEVDEVFVATDPDTEWEKIAYDLYSLIKPYNIEIYRIEYHEVTKRAILQAIEEKRKLDENLVRAQIVRRIADRRVGFSLSEKLQKYFNNPNYSAWRVQTPVLGWVIQRYEQSKEKKAVIYIYFQDLSDQGIQKEGVFVKKVLTFEEDDTEKVKNIKKEKEVFIRILDKKQEKINPFPPFTTDALLQEANDKLRLGADEVMKIAQDLFESWVITYHRTDSTHISDYGIGIAKEILKEKGWEQYFYPRHWGESGTHEAIRPTKPYDMETLRAMVESGMILGNFTRNHYRVYDLIFRRFLASQMKFFVQEKANIEIEFLNINYKKQVEIPTNIIENGWNLIIPQGIYLIDEGKKEISVDKKMVPKIPPYTQWTLIAQMKERWLGRPSTYATIISTLLRRWYITQIPKTGWLIPTKKWRIVYEFLTSRYKDLVSEEFTAYLEKQMDEVENGADHNEILKQLYNLIQKYINSEKD